MMINTQRALNSRNQYNVVFWINHTDTGPAIVAIFCVDEFPFMRSISPMFIQFELFCVTFGHGAVKQNPVTVHSFQVDMPT